MGEFTKEQLNCFKFTSVVKRDFPIALRKTFKAMWDEKYGPSEIWDDSDSVRNSFLAKEGGAASTKVPTQISYEKWDCTALFQATIHAKSFAIPDSKGHLKTLYDLYLRPLGLPDGSFHSSVVSPRGDPEETRRLAIDQLRRLRNWQCHQADDKMDKVTFDQNIRLTVEAFQALGISSKRIQNLGKSPQSNLSTPETSNLRFQRNMAIGVGLLH
ncbi:PREDICTED: uncharacterized protein LOC107331382 [Acropora digitifera]|uniref:uncharacterized protein LOC107331382 n=1 Tax=Acropora digitifera TaxID=70779 RepID=UPI00077ADE64|nr:PREDICTED: uncharacterized protein LOC107331382 [Acropora digitifera]XP_015751447.1 PREDICTED: uncharacterized protein LOC107331382 [Acropora digitifera]XP_015751448.1 PREDICTED: uncharacterized protein LOC107331382 [Acropora digitifera]